MALSLRDPTISQVTREQMLNWLTEWRATQEVQDSLRQFLSEKLEEVEPGLSEQMVETSQRDDYADNEVPFVQLIMDDVASYG
jgi:hypothetical protein